MFQNVLDKVLNFKDLPRANKEIKYYSRTLTEFKDFSRQLLKFKIFPRSCEPWVHKDAQANCFDIRIA